MKEFRGSLIAIALLILVVGIYMFSTPKSVSTTEETIIFRFEKHDVQKVRIARPSEDEIVLVEREGSWFVEGKEWRADPSMVNRIKHQLHDLDARTKVVVDSKEPTRYGLGENAIRVSLFLSRGVEYEFLVGDPNPSAVSYYIQPLPGKVVYTVKKSAMDYFSHDIRAFRDPRVARFDIKDAQEISLVSANQSLILRKTGVGKWELEEPKIDVDYGEVRRILSKMAALKAQRFIEETDLEPDVDYGFSLPLLTMKVSLPDRVIELLIGSEFIEARSELAYIRLSDSSTVYVGRSGLSELIGLDVESLRNKKICSVRVEEIVGMEGELLGGTSKGMGAVQNKAGEWSWTDGSLVSGSTPKRLANAIADLSVLSFETERPNKTAQARVLFTTEEGEKELFIGSIAEEKRDEEGNVFSRYYAWLGEGMYTVDGHVLLVLKDLIREQRRKDEEDKKTQELHERIEK
jgi:hypothetical protein